MIKDVRRGRDFTPRQLAQWKRICNLRTSVVTELKNRGVNDIFIACVDGLKGFPEAIETVFPKTDVQLCIVHMVRNSLKFVSWKQRKEVAADLKAILLNPKAPCTFWALSP